jgi:hypothetical protein
MSEATSYKSAQRNTEAVSRNFPPDITAKKTTVGMVKTENVREKKLT